MVRVNRPYLAVASRQAAFANSCPVICRNELARVRGSLLLVHFAQQAELTKNLINHISRIGILQPNDLSPHDPENDAITTDSQPVKFFQLTVQRYNVPAPSLQVSKRGAHTALGFGS